MYSNSHYLQHIDTTSGEVVLTVGAYDLIITGGIYVDIRRNDWIDIINVDTSEMVVLERKTMFSSWENRGIVKIYGFVIEKYGNCQVRINHPDAIELYKSQFFLWKFILNPPKRESIFIRIQRQ